MRRRNGRTLEASATRVLSVRGLARAPRVKGVSFDLRKGEVLGLGGLVGAGRTELARLLFGADRPQTGSMTLEGKPYAPRSPADGVKSGVGFVPEERRAEGLILSKSLAFNVGLANLQSIIFHPALPFISGSRRKALAERAIRDLAIKTTSAETPVGRLERRQSTESRHRQVAARRSRKCSFSTSRLAASTSARGPKFTA